MKVAQSYMKHPETGKLLLPGQIYHMSEHIRPTTKIEPEKQEMVKPKKTRSKGVDKNDISSGNDSETVGGQ